MTSQCGLERISLTFLMSLSSPSLNVSFAAKLLMNASISSYTPFHRKERIRAFLAMPMSFIRSKFVGEPRLFNASFLCHL